MTTSEAPRVRTPLLDPRPGRIGGYALLLVLAAAAFGNAAAYVANAGNPLVASDAWYFLDAFLRPAMESGPSLQDFYVKRGASDHAQPLYKLLLFANAYWFELDFVVEALIGLLFAVVLFLLVAWTTRVDRSLQPPLFRGALFGALAVVLVTLNSGTVFDWSLVTLNYLTYFLVLLAAFAAWRALHGEGQLPLALAAFLVAAAFDGVGIIAGAALAGAAAWAGVRLGKLKVALLVIAMIVATQVAFRVIEPWLTPAFAPSDTHVGSQLATLLGLGWEWLEVVRIIFGATIAHLNQVLQLAPDYAVRISSGFAVLAIAMHAWFWWRALKGPVNLAVFYAVVVMLLFYGLSAAIVYERVPLNGVAYLHQTRYVGIYLLANVAVVLMLLGQRLQMRTVRARATACSGFALLLALQVALSVHTWREGNHLHLYYHKMASQTLALGANPEQVPPGCLPLVHACEFDPVTRRAVTSFLARHGLNVYSPAFAARYGLRGLVDHYTRPGLRQSDPDVLPSRVRVRVKVRLGAAAPGEAPGVGQHVRVDAGRGLDVEVEVEVDPK